jgi:3-methyl-2-oxobutanoate hydroxymethyltransferase
MLGLFTKFRPRFVRRYAELATTLQDCFRRYCSDVKGRSFPGEEECYRRGDDPA